MLILTRYVGQMIRIGDDIEVTVLGVDKHGQVRIGINAPKEVLTLREEVPKREQEQQVS